MLKTKPRGALSEELVDAVATGVDEESPITRRDGGDAAAREGWQRVIDHKLIEWGRDPSRLEDEGVEAPTKQMIRGAISLAEAFRDAGFPPPHSVVPDPNGGIVFERRQGDVAEVFHIWDDGTVEYRRFQGTRLVERWTL